MNTKTIKVPEQLFRTGTSTKGADGTLRLSISSDEPYLRYDWWADEEYYEVLSHKEGDVDMTRLKAGTPLLYNHKRDIHIGRNIGFELKGGKIYVDSKISNAPDVESQRIKIEEDILVDTSVGYEILDDGECIGAKNGIPIFKFKWAPYEASMVTVPADFTVGKGRQRSKEEPPKFREIAVSYAKHIDLLQTNGNKAKRMTPEEIAELQKDLTETKAKLVTAEADAAKAKTDLEAANAKALADVEQAKKDGAKEAKDAEDKRILDLKKCADEIGGVHKIDLSKALVEHIAGAKSVADFKDHILKTGFKGAPVNTPSEAEGKKSLSRPEFNKLSAKEQSAFCRSGGQITD